MIPSSVLPGRERERFIEPRAPEARPGGPTVTLPSTEAPPGAAETTLVVRRIEITGATVYPAAEFEALYTDLVGRRVPLAAIYDLARRITAKYGADGYVLSRAIVPPQALAPGGATIRIQVVEGYVDRVEWPAKLSLYRDFFSDYAARITAERPANIRTIERNLLLAGDLPGLKFSTSLVASTRNPGASTLVVEVTEKPVDLLARVDNRGTQAIGPLQYFVSGSLNNALGVHEAFSLAYAGVYQFKELQLFAPSYRQVLNSEGLTAFANLTYSFGKPGTALLELFNFKARNLVVEAGLSQPVIRSREANLLLTGLIFASEGYADFDFGAGGRLPIADRLRGVRGRVDADFADAWSGINQVGLTLSQGFDGIGASPNGGPSLSRAVGRVDFTKVELYASRRQPLVGPFSAVIAGYAQHSFSPLLAAEQCAFGGRFFGRAFDPSELIGDRCWFGSAELRYELPVSALAPLLSAQASGARVLGAHVFAFGDVGRIEVDQAAEGTPSRLQGASTGGGLRFGVGPGVGGPPVLNVELTAAKAVDVPRDDRRFLFGPRDDWRFFFMTTARY